MAPTGKWVQVRKTPDDGFLLQNGGKGGKIDDSGYPVELNNIGITQDGATVGLRGRLRG